MEHLTFPKYTENNTAFLGKFQTLVPPSEFEKRKKKKIPTLFPSTSPVWPAQNSHRWVLEYDWVLQI